jgi:hypothetical protein
MWTLPISESAEVSQWALYIYHYSEVNTARTYAHNAQCMYTQAKEEKVFSISKSDQTGPKV